MTFPSVIGCPQCKGYGFLKGHIDNCEECLGTGIGITDELPVIMFGDDPIEQPKAITKQPWYISHAETIAQNVGGQLVAFVILWAYNIPLHTSLSLQLTFLIAAYARGYAIRRWFENRRKL